MSFEHFVSELELLVASFRKQINDTSKEAYNEQALRNDYLNPFWRALGWDLENKDSLPQSLREVQIEMRVDVAGKSKRADYIFRTDGIDRFVCEAKAAGVDLLPRHAFQAQRYAFNLRILTGVLTNFKRLQVFIVGARPDIQAPFYWAEEFKFDQYLSRARELWDLFAKPNVVAGSIDRFIASQRKISVRGRSRQGWQVVPARTRPVDDEFLEDIERYRSVLAQDLLIWNPKFKWNDYSINEAVQRIIDRVLFVRICEDRGIDTGRTLESILEDWHNAHDEPQRLYPKLTAHFRSLDTAFNGALFRAHFSEQLIIPDSFFDQIIRDLSSEDSPFLFNTLPVEIIGSVYERFIGKTIQIKGGARPKADVELKPAVRKAGGVYYTPRYIVNYIVEATLGPMLNNRELKDASKIKILDPACGSGSFLIRVFERLCEYYIDWYFRHPNQQKPAICYTDTTGSLQLTTHQKRQILLNNIFGVDVDGQAVEVTMLSLYLKILEGETRSSLGQQQRLFPKETFLPDLSSNIRLGNSLIDADMTGDSEDQTSHEMFDWGTEFEPIMRRGGFDVIVGNPPYVTGEFIPDAQIEYLKEHYSSAVGKFDLYMTFVERSLDLRSKLGNIGLIVPNKFMVTRSGRGLRALLAKEHLEEIVDFRDSRVFEGVTNYPCILVLRGTAVDDQLTYRYCITRPDKEVKRVMISTSALGAEPWVFSDSEEARLLSRLRNGSDRALRSEIARFSTGVQTGSDTVLTFTQHQIADLGLETVFLRPFLRGRNVKRYHISSSGKQLFWPYSVDNDEIVSVKELKALAPNLYKSLIQKRSRLSGRVWFGKSAEELSGKWYGLMYREPDENFRKPHLVTPSLAIKPQFAFNNKGLRFMTGTAGVTGLIPSNPSELNCFYLMGLLNSSVCAFYMRQISPVFAGGFLKFTPPYLETFPLPILPLTSAKRKDIEVVAGRARDLMRISEKLETLISDSERTLSEAEYRSKERSLNLAVARLYGLSQDDLSAMEARSTPDHGLPSEGDSDEAVDALL